MRRELTAPTGVPPRRVLGGALGAAGAVAAGGAGFGVAKAVEPAGSSAGPATGVPMYGAHQAGIATPAQDRLAFAAFDVTTTDVADVQRLLGTWAAAAAQMTKGEPIGSVETAPQVPPIDTGE